MCEASPKNLNLDFYPHPTLRVCLVELGRMKKKKYGERKNEEGKHFKRYWIMQLVDVEELGDGALYPIWRLREMQQFGVQAFI